MATSKPIKVTVEVWKALKHISTEKETIISNVIEDLLSRKCEKCAFYNNEVCMNDKSPLATEVVDVDFGCVLFRMRRD